MLSRGLRRRVGMVPRNPSSIVTDPPAQRLTRSYYTSQKFSSANHHSPPHHHLWTLPSSSFPHPHPRHHHQHHRRHHQRGRSCQGGQRQEVARKCRWAHQATTHGEEAETNLTSVQPHPVTKYFFSRKSIQDIPRMLLLFLFAIMECWGKCYFTKLVHKSPLLKTIVTKKQATEMEDIPIPPSPLYWSDQDKGPNFFFYLTDQQWAKIGLKRTTRGHADQRGSF